jgi:hypothetical protein
VRAHCVALIVGSLTSASSAWAEEAPKPQPDPTTPSAAQPTPTAQPTAQPTPTPTAQPEAKPYMRFKAPEPFIDLPSAAEFDVPVSLSKRELVLPRLGVSARASFLYDRPSDWTSQVPNFGLGLAIGTGRRSELNLGFVAPIDGTMLLDVAFLWQGIGTQSFMLGLGGRLGMLTVHEQDETTLAVRPAFELPIAFRPHNVVRVETGLTLEAYVPTDGVSPSYASFITRTLSPTVDGPGVPLRGFVNLADYLFLGVETGVGVREMRSHMSAAQVTDGVFVPFGARLGGTVPIHGRPLIDISGQIGLPYLLLGERGWVTELWQLGLSVETYFGL